MSSSGRSRATASRCRSSGIRAPPPSVKSRVPVTRRGATPTRISPWSHARWPVMTSTSSVCPFPSTPAIPRISPARPRATRRRAGPRRARRCTVTRDTDATTVPVAIGGFSTRITTSRPTIIRARSRLDVTFGSVPDDAPIAEHDDAVDARLQLVELVRDEDDAGSLATMATRIAESRSHSLGPIDAVGSSRINSRASRCRSLTISTRCWRPTGRSSIRASGSSSRPNRSDSSRTATRTRWRSA